MANTILSVTELANRGVDVLVNMRPMVNTFNNDVVTGELAMNKGETVNVALPPSFTAATYNGSTLTSQDINNGSVAVTLDKDEVVPTTISNREYGKSAQDLDDTVILPIMKALSTGMDASIFTALAAGDTLTAVPDAAFSIAQIELGLRALLATDCPDNDLHMSISHYDASVARQIQGIYSQDINRENNNRSTSVGSYAGIDIFGTSSISSAGATIDNWLYDSNFATVAMRGLADVTDAPGVEAATASYKGMTVTVTRQWDTAKQAVVTVFRTLYGVKVLDGNRGINVITTGLGA